MAFICGSFRSQQEDSNDVLSPFSSTSPTRKPSKQQPIFGSRRSKAATNPYSDRGLDKFEALLAELDQKRREILSKKGSEDVSMVKFIYTSPNEVLKPIVIKIQSQTKQDNTSSSSTSPDHHKENIAFVKGFGDNEPIEEKRKKPLVDEATHERITFEQVKRKIGELWKPWYYLPLFVMLILVLLMFSGRSFAILFTSMGWYLIPIVNERLHNSKQPNNTVTKKRKTT